MKGEALIDNKKYISNKCDRFIRDSKQKLEENGYCYVYTEWQVQSLKHAVAGVQSIKQNGIFLLTTRTRR